jgi:hypothetical protein
MALTAEQEMQRNALAQQLMSGQGDPNMRNAALNEWARLEGMRRDPYGFDPYGSGGTTAGQGSVPTSIDSVPPGIGGGPGPLSSFPGTFPSDPNSLTASTQPAGGPAPQGGGPPNTTEAPTGGPAPQGGGPPSTEQGDPQGQSEPAPEIDARGGAKESEQEIEQGPIASVEIGELSSPSFNTQGTNPAQTTPAPPVEEPPVTEMTATNVPAAPYETDVPGMGFGVHSNVEAPNYGYGPAGPVPGGAFPSTQEAPPGTAPANINAEHSQFGQVGTNPFGGAVYGPQGTLEGVPYSGYYDATMPQDVQEQGLGYGPPGSIPGGQFGPNPLGEVRGGLDPEALQSYALDTPQGTTQGQGITGAALGGVQGGLGGVQGAPGIDTVDFGDVVGDVDGLDGLDGLDGMDGMDGVDGVDGAGVDGADGVDGVDGMDGQDGPGGGGQDGQDGQDGPGGNDGNDGNDNDGDDDDGDDDS